MNPIRERCFEALEYVVWRMSYLSNCRRPSRRFNETKKHQNHWVAIRVGYFLLVQVTIRTTNDAHRPRLSTTWHLISARLWSERSENPPCSTCDSGSGRDRFQCSVICQPSATLTGLWLFEEILYILWAVKYQSRPFSVLWGSLWRKDRSLVSVGLLNCAYFCGQDIALKLNRAKCLMEICLCLSLNETISSKWLNNDGLDWWRGALWNTQEGDSPGNLACPLYIRTLDRAVWIRPRIWLTITCSIGLVMYT